MKTYKGLSYRSSIGPSTVQMVPHGCWIWASHKMGQLIAIIALLCCIGIGQAEAQAIASWSLPTCTKDSQSRLIQLQNDKTSIERDRNSLKNFWLPLVETEEKRALDSCSMATAETDSAYAAKQERCLKAYIKLDRLRSDIQAAEDKILEIKHRIESNPCSVGAS